ncbi:MAG: hypothetical protein AAGF32_10925 [Pseudomonadota bacterium]
MALFVTLLSFPAMSGFVADQKRADAQVADSFTKPSEVLAAINAYREAKQPDRVPGLMQAMVRLGIIDDPEKAGIYIGFLAGVLQENQVDAPELIARMFPLPPPQQVVLIKAIVFSELPNWHALLQQFAERMPARAVMIDRYLNGQAKTLRQLPLADAATLDLHWGLYFATGQWAPATRIIDALQWAGEKNEIEKLTVGSMAKWTYATNAARDKNLRDLARAQLAYQPQEVKGHLTEVIEAAELFETGRLRDKALKSIEKLRAQGPQRVRDINTWGQAGQTVLALGCVAAAALGQVQLGLPCVVGGALSSAALKYLVPRPGPQL